MIRLCESVGRHAGLALAAGLFGCSSAPHAEEGPVDSGATVVYDGSSAITRTGTGCGQGSSCTPGETAPSLAAGEGLQIVTPKNAIVVQPGAEVFLCYYRTLPNDASIDVGGFQSWMTAGSSHHFIAYQVGAGSTARFGQSFPAVSPAVPR